MAVDRLKQAQEWAARLFVIALVLLLPLAILAARRLPAGTVRLHAAMPEAGGWQPGHLTARVGQPLTLELTSDDVVHSFAIGAGPDGQPYPLEPVEVKPGQTTRLTLTFDQPGVYTYYCTRWCGANHWRMRGSIRVEGETAAADTVPAGPPLYVELGLDIDAPHPPPVQPDTLPSAARGAALNLPYPEALPAAPFRSQSPAAAWLDLRAQPDLAHLDDMALWDALAHFWQQSVGAEVLAQGEALYRQDCAACHGESGGGDGVFAHAPEAAPAAAGAMRGHTTEPATAFTGPALLGASEALLQGKILRGGMGTGMPAWGPLYTEEQLSAVAAYLWTFQFAREE